MSLICTRTIIADIDSKSFMIFRKGSSKTEDDLHLKLVYLGQKLVIYKYPAMHGNFPFVLQS